MSIKLKSFSLKDNKTSNKQYDFELNEEMKMLIHTFMTKSAQNIGGVNYLLALMEAMKTKKPNALIHNGKQIRA